MRTATLAFAATLLLLLATACDSPGTPVPELRDPNLETTDHRALEAARALWTARGATNYDMRFNWNCFCPTELTETTSLQIRGTTVTVTSPIRSKTFLTPHNRSVPSLFTLIQDALDKRAAALNVTYHPTLGYPTQAYIDYDLMIADEELGFTVHNLTLH